MFGSETLEVMIGIIFVFILISTICSAIREIIEAVVKSRAAYLEHGIRQLLQDQNGTELANSFYNHPLISGLFAGQYKPGDPKKKKPSYLAWGGDLPSYIPSRNFATVLFDIASRGQAMTAASSDPTSHVMSLDKIRANVLALQNPPVQRILLTAIDSAQGDLNRAIANVEGWYDSAMDRVSGWYKRRTHGILFFIALTLAATMNIDTVQIVDHLYTNNSVRANIVAEAEKAVAAPAATTTADAEARAEQARMQLQSLHLPVGWPATQPLEHWYQFLAMFAGWLVTAFAATLGAPFWFDILNKVMVIRSTVKPHEKSREEASEDRQARPAPMMFMQPQMAAAGPAPAAAPVAPAAAAPAATLATHGGPPATILPPAPRASIPASADDDSDASGCDVTADASTATSDEDLPPAEGGVA